MSSENQKSESTTSPFVRFFLDETPSAFLTFASLFTVPQIFSWVDLVFILQQWLTVHLSLIRELFSHSPWWISMKSQFISSERLSPSYIYIAPSFKFPQFWIQLWSPHSLVFSLYLPSSYVLLTTSSPALYLEINLIMLPNIFIGVRTLSLQPLPRFFKQENPFPLVWFSWTIICPLPIHSFLSYSTHQRKFFSK